jgi:exosortase A-associated hydrolase 1
MSYTEQALAIDCHGDALAGIACVPDTPRDTAVVIVVGGPQYRVGSHRQFVLLARAVAQAGYAALRFDVRGMGDSSGDARDFEAISDDIGCALTALQQALPTVQRFVLWGLCDGASAALLYVERTHDPRVAGLCLANPWVRSEASLARTQVKHYYTQRLLQRDFWLKLLSGRVGIDALRGLARSMLRSLRGASAAAADCPYQQHMAAAWQRFGGPLLLVLSGDDYTAKEFLEFVAVDPAWHVALARPGLQRHDISDADHTFSTPASRERAEAVMLSWLHDSWGSAR